MNVLNYFLTPTYYWFSKAHTHDWSFRKVSSWKLSLIKDLQVLSLYMCTVNCQDKVQAIPFMLVSIRIIGMILLFPANPFYSFDILFSLFTTIVYRVLPGEYLFGVFIYNNNTGWRVLFYLDFFRFLWKTLITKSCFL